MPLRTMIPPMARRPSDRCCHAGRFWHHWVGTADTAGTVKVSPASVSAEGMVDLTVKYTATKHLAERASKATAAEDLNSTYGRIQYYAASWLGS